MFDAYEAVDGIIDEINENYNESCYEDIYDELCERVECGLLSVADAELINEAAYEKYMMEDAINRHMKKNLNLYNDVNNKARYYNNMIEKLGYNSKKIRDNLRKYEDIRSDRYDKLDSLASLRYYGAPLLGRNRSISATDVVRSNNLRDMDRGLQEQIAQGRYYNRRGIKQRPSNRFLELQNQAKQAGVYKRSSDLPKK